MIFALFGCEAVLTEPVAYEAETVQWCRILLGRTAEEVRSRARLMVKAEKSKREEDRNRAGALSPLPLTIL
jgi:hypothetical protein